MKRSGLIFLITGASLVLTGCNGDFNEWTNDCIQAGGHIARTHTGYLQNRYECFVDDKIFTVPGYEGM